VPTPSLTTILPDRLHHTHSFTNPYDWSAKLRSVEATKTPSLAASSGGPQSVARPRAELLIPPAKHGRQGKPRKDGKPSESKSDGLRAAMTARLQSADGKACYALRKQTVEPVFGQVKEQQCARRFMRRGLAACAAEWKLLCGTHNLVKLWRSQTAQPPGMLATT
jgi:Transposase DDE domain